MTNEEKKILRTNESQNFLELLTKKQVMQILHISRSTLHRLEKKGELKPIKITERTHLYTIDNLRKFIERKART